MQGSQVCILCDIMALVSFVVVRGSSAASCLIPGILKSVWFSFVFLKFVVQHPVVSHLLESQTVICSSTALSCEILHIQVLRTSAPAPFFSVNGKNTSVYGLDVTQARDRMWVRLLSFRTSSDWVHDLEPNWPWRILWLSLHWDSV